MGGNGEKKKYLKKKLEIHFGSSKIKTYRKNIWFGDGIF